MSRPKIRPGSSSPEPSGEVRMKTETVNWPPSAGVEESRQPGWSPWGCFGELPREIEQGTWAGLRRPVVLISPSEKQVRVLLPEMVGSQEPGL